MKVIGIEELNLAINIARPSIEKLLEAEGTTWGPKWVVVVIDVPGLSRHIITIGEVTDWNPEWGEEKDFKEIAMAKADLCNRLNMDTRQIVENYPWLLEEGDFLYAGGSHEAGITVAASGAKSEADEGIGYMIINALTTIGLLRRRALVEEGVGRL